MGTLKRSASLAALLAALISPAHAQKVSNLVGEWSAEGQARRSPDGRPVRLTCRASTTPEGEGVRMAGTCRALLIFSSRMNTFLREDGNRFTGTMEGSPDGPAALSGTGEDGGLRLELTYARPVHGDDEARMTIEADGPDRFRMRIIDRSPETGRQVTMTDLVFTRR